MILRKLQQKQLYAGVLHIQFTGSIHVDPELLKIAIWRKCYPVLVTVGLICLRRTLSQAKSHFGTFAPDLAM